MNVKIEKLDSFGRGICRVDGKICFVEDALPGEVVNLKFINSKKKYLEAEVISYDEISPLRKDVCPYQKKCGGCHLLMLDEEYHDDFKLQKVKDVLCRRYNISSDIISIEKSLIEKHYRNKVTFHIDNKRMGLYEKNSNILVEVDNCLLLDDAINQLIPTLKQIVKNNDVEEIIVKVGNGCREILVGIKGVVTNLLDLEENVDVLYINGECVTEKKQILSYIGNKKFLVSLSSFFQINKNVTEKLYDEVKSLVKDSNSKKVLDLYCGTGTVGIYISDVADEVLGIEVVESAIEDANLNKQINNVTNISFLSGKVEEHIENLSKWDTVIVDPPRSGLSKNVIENIIRISPETIIYVSCNVDTLGRDLELLSNEYEVLKVKAFDMFFYTYHVECVCILRLK